MGQRTDVGALAASYADADARQVVLFELHFVDVDERLAHFDLLARSSQFVGPHAVDLFGRIDRRRLEAFARECGEGFEYLPARDVLRGEGRVDGMFEVVAGGRGAQHDVGHVLLLLGLQGVDHLGGAADADQQDARGQRVERARVADLDLAVAEPAERGLDLAYDVGGRPAQGLVDDGDVALLEVEAPQVECLLHQQK